MIPSYRATSTTTLTAPAVAGDAERFGGVLEWEAVGDQCVGDLWAGRQHLGGLLHLTPAAVGAVPA